MTGVLFDGWTIVRLKQNELTTPDNSFKFRQSRRQAPVDQRLDNAIRWINHYPADSVVGFVNTYPLDSDLSSGQRYPAFDQPRPEESRDISNQLKKFEGKMST